MTDDRLIITIEGKDGVSKIFVAVSKSADVAGKSVEKAGNDGKKAMKGLDEETKKAAKSADDLANQYTKVGAAIGAALGTISKLGASYREQRLELQSLNAQYGSSADSIIRFTETIQDHYNQSNDAARDSALTFATLYRNYEMSEQQIIQLMERSADISAARGRNMTEVSQMIQNALRGEAEYIEQIGVTLNDTYVASEYAARGLGNWNTLTDEATKAQFRYQLLLEQTVDTQGRANEEAARAGGWMRERINDTQDLAQRTGQLLGPLGEMGAEFSQIAIGLPVVAGGMGRLVGMIQSSTRASMAMSLALGPVGLAITGLTVLGAGLWQSFREGRAEAQALTQSIGDLDSTIENLRRRGEDNLANLAEEFKRSVDEINGARIGIDEMSDAQAISLAEGVSGGIKMGAEDAREWLRTWNPDVTIGLHLDDADLTKVYDKIEDVLSDPNINSEAFIEWANGLLEAAAATETVTDDYEAFLAIMERAPSDFSIHRYTESATGLVAAFGLLNDEAETWIEKLMKINEIQEGDSFSERFMKTLGLNAAERGQVNRYLDRFADLTSVAKSPGPDEGHQAWIDWVNEAGISELERAQRVKIANAAMREMSATTDESTAATEENARAVRLTADAYREQASATELAGMALNAHVGSALAAAEAERQLQQEIMSNLEAMIDVAGFGDPLSRWNLDGNATDMSTLAMNTQHQATAMSNVYRVAVENTNALGQQSSAIEQWVKELVGVQGEYGKIDDLVKAGRITGEVGVFTGNSEYAQAQRAYNDIARENAEIQEHILTIQAKQAPLVRDQVAAYENYLQTLSDLPAEQQLVALGWMDSTEAGRAMELQTLAVAAAQGKLGENGKEIFTDMITGAAQADPVLKALLIDMGLISEGADGTITVNFSGVEEGRSEIGALNETIGILIDLLDDGQINGSFKITADDAASPVIRTARQNLDDADGQSATMSLYLNDYATLGLSVADQMLSALDGRSATTTIRTVYENRGLGYSASAAGGVVGYARGGTIPVELAEAGMEMIRFAAGGTAMVAQRGVYGLSPGDFVAPHNMVRDNSYGAPTVNVYVQGSVVTERELTHVIAQAISTEMAGLADERWGA